MATLTEIEQLILFTFKVNIGVGKIGNLGDLQTTVNNKLTDKGFSNLQFKDLVNCCEKLKDLGYLKVQSYQDYEITQEGSRAITFRNDL